jgi:glycosyltransferase involved in cell wall biosynthesis
LSVTRPDPLVTIVTPTLNADRFLEATIKSVLGQDYPRIQYIIADGGSTDETHAIAARHSAHLDFLSQPDVGQADAVNRAFEMAEGEIFTFLNADDIYVPGAVTAAVGAFAAFPKAAVIFGEANWIDEKDAIISRYPVELYRFSQFSRRCFICQPAAFIRTDVFREVGGLDTGLNFAFDYDLWIRIGKSHPFGRLDRILAGSRMHLANKTLGHRSASFLESIQVVRRHFGYVPPPMIYGYCHALISKNDLFFSPPKSSALAKWLSLPVGLALNWRRLRQYAAELRSGDG